MPIKATLSFHMDHRHIDKHYNRLINVLYVASIKLYDNIYYDKNMTRENAFHKLFDNEIEEYKAKQKRLELRTNNYLDKLLKLRKSKRNCFLQRGDKAHPNKSLPNFKKLFIQHIISLYSSVICTIS